jgi:type II secretory pathway pseudopilin PulG
MKKNESARIRRQRGYTLLEYAAGAAILLGLLTVGLTNMGTGVRDLLTRIGNFATQSQLPAPPSGGNQ